MRFWLVTLVALAGCGGARLELRGAPAQPFEVVVIPGCPTEDDGAPSRCQLARALHGAELWEHGWARGFITSGAAVHTPWVEAEMIAALMVAAGVPADRIWIEASALHTDENMYYSLAIARKLRFARLAVASNRAHARGGCMMMVDWGQPCSALALDEGAARARHTKLPQLDAVRTPRVADWLPLVERERAIVRETGVHRPPSFLLYPFLGFLRLQGQRWTPRPPAHFSVETWAARQAALTRQPFVQ